MTTIEYVLGGLALVVVVAIALQVLGIVSWPTRWWMRRRRRDDDA